MSLREAIAASNVAIYQELAWRIGLKRMRKEISRLSYGNEKIGPAVDNFWLEGPLKISAVEQTLFLAQLAQETLPLPKDFQTTVHQLIQLEQKDGSTLYGKTGWVNAPNPGVGWWVGWVRKDHRIYAFALNIDIRQAGDADKRIPPNGSRWAKPALKHWAYFEQPDPSFHRACAKSRAGR